MKFLYKLLRQDPNSREGIIAATSTLGILTNLVVSAVKVIIGLLASSIAVVSEGINNAADVLNSLLMLIGAKLAGKHPDKKHPFGYGRIEYLTGLIIGVLILITGVEMFTSSVKLIFNPEPISVSYVTLAVVALSAVVKFALGVYTMKMGKKADSGALEAVGVDSRNDSFASLVTVISTLAFLLFHVSIDAWAGALTSLLIIKAGVDVLKETVGDLLGRPGEHELAEQIYREVRSTEGVIGAADMMLHNYGPDAWAGSVNIEIDHNETVGEVYQRIHALQLRIMHEYHVTMVFGIYAVDNDREKSRALRKEIGAFIKKTDGVKSFHAVYLDEQEKTLYCDLIVDYTLRDWDKLREDFTAYMQPLTNGYKLELTIETEFV